MAENIEMDDINDDVRPADTPGKTGETEFIEPGNDPRDDPLLRPDRMGEINKLRGLRNEFRRTNLEFMKDARRYTEDKKDFLRNVLKLNVTKGAGPSSTELLENIELTKTGVKFKGVEVVDKQGVYTNSKFVTEFKRLCEEAKQEYNKTQRSRARKILGDEVSGETVEKVHDNVVEEIEMRATSEGDDLIDQGERLGLSENTMTEVESTINEHETHEALAKGTLHRQTGMTYKEKIEVLEKDHEHWNEMAEKEQDKNISNYYKSVARIAALEADLIRLRYDQAPQTQEVQEIYDGLVEENVMTRFERFKQWAKENLGTISTLAIAVGSLVTSIVLATKGSVTRMGRLARDVGRKGSSFAKGVGKFLGAAAPVVSAVIGLTSKILSLMGKGLLFLGNNLWLLFLLVTYALYEWTERSRNK